MIHPAFRSAGVGAAFAAGVFVASALGQGPASQSALKPAGFGTALRSGVSGVVRDRNGQPQIGAAVELLNARYAVIARTFTDDRGRYSLPQLGAGLYQLKASSSLLLPSVRPHLRLLANSNAIVNFTLSGLYGALDWLPAESRDAHTPNDDWDWTLRLATNRPLLRLLEPGAAPEQAASTQRRGIVREAPTRFGQGGLEQQVEWARSGADGRAVLLAGGIAMTPDGTGRMVASAGYRQELAPNRSTTTVVTFAERPGIEGSGQSGLADIRIRSAGTMRFGDLADLSAGTELEAIRLGEGGPVVGEHPFATLAVHGDATTVEYRAASAPTATDARRLEQQVSGDAPAVVQQNGRLEIEQGLHQELRVSRRVGTWTGDVAVFNDTLHFPVVQGAVHNPARGDEATVDSKDVLYDPGTGIIAVSGQSYRHGGVLALLRDQLSRDTWISLRYAMGEAITAPAEISAGVGAASFKARNTQSAAVAAGTRITASGTQVRGSYRWQPVSTLTSVAPFEPGPPDAYLGLSVRQPLHLEQVGAGKIEAILDVRNLLAQGYRPFLSQDGTTVYFAQAQRCIAGGISFSF